MILYYILYYTWYYTILYKDATRKLIKLINELGKVAGYKINTSKSAAFLSLTPKGQKKKLRQQTHWPSQQKE